MEKIHEKWTLEVPSCALTHGRAKANWQSHALSCTAPGTYKSGSRAARVCCMLAALSLENRLIGSVSGLASLRVIKNSDKNLIGSGQPGRTRLNRFKHVDAYQNGLGCLQIRLGPLRACSTWASSA